MKCFNILAGILLILLMGACTREKNMQYPLTVDNPFVTHSKTSSISIEKMVLTDSATVLSIHATYRPHNWIRIAKGSKLITDGGTELTVVSAEGIQLDSLFWMPDSGEADFTLTFETMPADAKYFDYIECSYEGCFNLYGIYFSADKPDIKVPAEWKNIKYPKDETLPASTLSKDSAVVSGYISGYRPEMDITLTLYYSPFGQNQKDVPVPVDVNGKFRVVATPFLPGSAFLVFQNRAYSFFLVPGKETSIFFDLTKFADESYAPDYKGCMALVGHEMASNLSTKNSFGNLLEHDSLDEKPAAVILPYLNRKLKETCDSIDLMEVSDAYKKLSKISAETEYMNMRFNFDRYWTNLCMRQANISSQKEYQTFMANFKHPASSVVDSLKTNVPSLECINVPYFSLSHSILNLYVQNQEIFPAITNPDNAEVFKAYALMTKFEGGSTLSDDEMKEFDSFKNPSFKELLDNRIAERKAKLEALKENKSAHIHELDDVAPDKILNTILEKYQGKAVLLDIWATWCGPCRSAHKTILPLKEELKNEEVVFVYLTGTTSPVDKWGEMIKEISGEHYYLTGEQYQSVLSQFESQGVPTYLVFDRNGNFEYKSVGFPGNETMKANLLKALEK
ncbi:MAG: TlpA family protein disulfide reductase [Prolixibacteraceae bacterium]|nr:TlpA family protein disulfide reductase [Prolixibacteraceae bacterium]